MRPALSDRDISILRAALRIAAEAVINQPHTPQEVDDLMEERSRYLHMDRRLSHRRKVQT